MTTNYQKLITIYLFNCFLLTQLQGQIDTNTTKSDTVFDGEVVSSKWVDHGLTTGISFTKYFYGEIGYFRSSVSEFGGFPIGTTTMNYGLEFSYFDKAIIAPKIQGRLHFLILNTSLSVLYYSDLNESYSIKVRPEVGIGLWNIDINYGYNIGIFERNLNQINRHVISIRYYIPLYTSEYHEFDRQGNERPEK